VRINVEGIGAFSGTMRRANEEMRRAAESLGNTRIEFARMCVEFERQDLRQHLRSSRRLYRSLGASGLAVFALLLGQPIIPGLVITAAGWLVASAMIATHATVATRRLVEIDDELREHDLAEALGVSDVVLGPTFVTKQIDLNAPLISCRCTVPVVHGYGVLTRTEARREASV